MSSTRRTILPDPAGLWGVTIFIILCSIGGAKALKDGDTLWHIRMGQEMIARRAILKTDIFSHTAYGQPWHAHEWLSEILMAAMHDWAGLAGVTIFYLAIISLAFTVILKVTCKFANEYTASLATAIALPSVYVHMLARPHIFTWLGAALTLFLLERGGRWPWLLIPISTIWANLHGGVLFGLVLQAIFWGGNCLDSYQDNISNWLKTCWAKGKSALLILIACVGATIINPFGYQIFLFPFKVASPVFAQGISEWRAPDFQALWFSKPWAVGVVLAALWSGRKLPWRWNLLALFLFWQTLSHARNLSLAALLLIPYFSIFLRDILGGIAFWRRKITDGIDLLLSPWSGPIGIILLTLIFLSVIAEDTLGARGFAKTSFPLAKENLDEVVAFLDKGYPEGNLYNDYEWGDYLIYAFKKPPLVFIDGRADMYGEDLFSEHNRILNLDVGTDDLLVKYEIGWTLLPKESILNRNLRDCKGWELLYTDDFVEILKKSP